MNNKLIYIYQFLYKTASGKYSLSSFFPLFSIAIGSLIILLVLGTMDGMERTIFKTIETAHFTYRGDLLDNNYSRYSDPYVGRTKQYVIIKNNKPTVVEITSIDKFQRFKKNHIKNYLKEQNPPNNFQAEVIIGKELSDRLGIKTADSIHIISPLDVNLMTSYIPASDVYVSGIFSYGGDLPLDYESNHIFMSDSQDLKILQYSDNDKLFFSSEDAGNIPLDFIKKYNLEHWSEAHKELAGALKIEKLLYSFFGYFVILIAGLSSSTLMSLFIIRKAKQLALLRISGCNDLFIMFIFAMNAITTSITGVLCGYFIYSIMVLFDSRYYWIKNIFFINFPEFSINFNFGYLPLIIIVSSVSMIIATIYPILKIKNSNLINLLNNKL